MLKDFEKLSPEEKALAVQESPKLAKVIEADSIVKYTDQVFDKYGTLPEKEIKDIVDHIQQSNYEPEIEKYLLDNLPKEVKAEIQRLNRIKDFGSDFTENPVVEKKPVDKKKKERQITSKGKLAFIDKYEAVSPNV